MSRIKNRDIYLKDGDQIYFGNSQDSAIWFAGGELRMNTTISGVDPTQNYHLSTKSYVDTQDTTISGDLQSNIDAKTNDVVDDTSPQLGGDLDLNDKYITLKPEPTSSGTGSGFISTVTVGTNSTGIGAALCIASGGNFAEANADSDTTMPCMSLALETGTGSKKVLLVGFMRNDGWNWTSIGQPIYVSTTSGVLTQTKPTGVGDQVQIVGIATHADRMLFNSNYAVAEV